MYSEKSHWLEVITFWNQNKDYMNNLHIFYIIITKYIETGYHSELSFTGYSAGTMLPYFLNQVSNGYRPAHAWSLEITFVWKVCVRVCACMCVCMSPPLRLLTTSGVMRWDMDSVWLVKHILQLGSYDWYH